MALSGAHEEQPGEWYAHDTSDVLALDDNDRMHDNHTEMHLHITDLEAAKIDAFNPPKQDKATASGIVQLNIPNTWSANV